MGKAGITPWREGWETGMQDGAADRQLDRRPFRYQRPNADSDSWHHGYHQGYQAGYYPETAVPPRRLSQLTGGEKREIRARLRAGEIKEVVAADYGLSYYAVSRLRTAAGGRTE